jgi:RNA polymerase sigma-B factor
LNLWKLSVFARLLIVPSLGLSGKGEARFRFRPSVMSKPFNSRATAEPAPCNGIRLSATNRATAAGSTGRTCQGRLPRSLQQRNARIEQYQQLVRPIALHYHLRCNEPLEDLLQVGLLGLLRAAELYCRQRQTPFDAFARPHIRGAILHYLRDTAPAVRLPRRLEEQHQQLAQLQRRFTKPPSTEQLREAMGLNPSQWQRLVDSQQHRRPVSLEQLMLDPDGATEVEAAESMPSAAPAEDHGPMRNLLGELDSSQRAVVERVVLAGWSYRRTGEALQISPMTVQRRLRSGLARLHQLLRPGAPQLPVASAVPG